jgi:hypothetical protein
MTDIPANGPAMVEIDVERISAIILATCHSSETNAVRALNAIAELWAENRSLSEIGQALNTTRGVVMGAIWRARRAGDPRFQRRAPKPKPRKLKPAGETVGAARRAPAPVEKPLRRSRSRSSSPVCVVIR